MIIKFPANKYSSVASAFMSRRVFIFFSSFSLVFPFPFCLCILWLSVTPKRSPGLNETTLARNGRPGSGRESGQTRFTADANCWPLTVCVYISYFFRSHYFVARRSHQRAPQKCKLRLLKSTFLQWSLEVSAVKKVAEESGKRTRRKENAKRTRRRRLTHGEC